MTNESRHLLSLFYGHRLHVEDACDNVDAPSVPMLALSQEILNTLIKEDINDIVRFLQSESKSFAISKRDVPQFSSIEDSAYRVPSIVEGCHVEDLTYTQMGFMLRTTPRTDVADHKYGENHAKTAVMLGLCAIIKHKVFVSYLGICFNKLGHEAKKKVLPKIVLFIPFIQNLFTQRANAAQVDLAMGMLAETTKRRRTSNVWTLIEIVNKNLKYEFQIHRD